MRYAFPGVLVWTDIISETVLKCLHVLMDVASKGIMRGGEKKQEIINSPSSWLTPPSHPEVEGQVRAEREGEPAGVWWPWASPQRSPLSLLLIHTNTHTPNHSTQNNCHVAAQLCQLDSD